MADLLLRDLLMATGGQLALAAMPPRDGDLLMLRRSTAVAANVQPGDLFWALRGESDDGMCHVEEAFARGAAGAMVCGRHIEPWPGKFTIRVDDVRHALWQTADHARARFCGTVVGTVGPASRTTISHCVHRVLASQLSGSVATHSMKSATCIASDIAALGMLNAHPSHDYVVLDLSGDDWCERADVVRRCCPHVCGVTITSELEDYSEVVRVLESLPSDGWAVLNGDDQELRRIAGTVLHEATQIIWVGRGAENDLVAELVQTDRGQRGCKVDGSLIRLNGAEADEVHAALAAVAIGKILNISDLSIFAALGNFSPPRNNERQHVRAGAVSFAADGAAPWFAAMLSDRSA